MLKLFKVYHLFYKIFNLKLKNLSYSISQACNYIFKKFFFIKKYNYLLDKIILLYILVYYKINS
jgi:hypothetical protein